MACETHQTVITYTIIPPKEPVTYENRNNAIATAFGIPAFSELTKEDLRTIIKEEVTASEKRMKEYIDLKIDGVEKSLNARIDATNAKIDALDKSLNARIDAVDKSLNARVDDMDENFDPFWIVMIIILTAIILPQIIIVFITVYNDIRERKIVETEIRKLRERVEALSQ